jgi:hypothetical protein
MAIKVCLGVSRKIGMPDYGSAGASCNLELEVDTSLLDADLAGFHERVKAAYVAAQQAVQDQLQRLQGTSAGRPTPDADGQSTDPKRSRAWGGPIRADRATSRQRRPATQRHGPPRPAPRPRRRQPFRPRPGRRVQPDRHARRRRAVSSGEIRAGRRSDRPSPQPGPPTRRSANVPALPRPPPDSPPRATPSPFQARWPAAPPGVQRARQRDLLPAGHARTSRA